MQHKFHPDDVRAALAGAASGLISTFVFFMVGWLNLFFWAAVGIWLGYRAHSRRQAIRAGAIFGASLAIFFLLSGFRGSPAVLLLFTIFSIVMCLPGAFGGVLSSVIGWYIKERQRQNREMI